MFLFKVERVFIEDAKNQIKMEYIRGDKVKRVRPWHKGKKDEQIEGDMSEIISSDPDTGETIKMRVLENADALAERLNNERKLFSAKGHNSRK